jgi:hypothetical protein
MWAGYLRTLLWLHVALGVGLVLSLCALAVVAWTAGARPGLVAFAFLWALGVLLFGFAQPRLMPGSSHWIVEVVHLLAGGIAIGLGTALAGAVERRREPQVAAH